MAASLRYPRDLSTVRFGRLAPLHPVRVEGDLRQDWWLCRCDCGGTATVRRSNLVAGITSSCGCLRRWSESRGHRYRLAGRLVTAEQAAQLLYLSPSTLRTWRLRYGPEEAQRRAEQRLADIRHRSTRADVAQAHITV